MAGPLDLALPPVPFGPGINVPSAMPFLVTGEEFLQFQIYSQNTSYPVGLHWRMLRADRQIQASHQTLLSHPTVAFQQTTAFYPLGEGLILNAGIIGEGGPLQYGMCFARLAITRGHDAAATLLGTLLADYVTTRWGIGWPGSAITKPAESGNTIVQYGGSAPPLGAEFTLAVTSNALWELIVFEIDLTTSAVAGGRTVDLRFDTGAAANVIGASAQVAGVPPSLTARLIWQQGMALETQVGGLGFRAGLPLRLKLRGGFGIRTLTSGLDPGDQFAAPRFEVLQTLEDI